MFPYKTGDHSFYYLNSAGLAHEANHVRECIFKGLKQSPEITHDLCILVAEILQDIRSQVGVVFDD